MGQVDNTLNDRREAALEKKSQNAGGSGYNGGMWEQSVETRLSELRDDIRTLSGKVDAHFLILSGMVIIAALGLAGLMAKGFGWL